MIRPRGTDKAKIIKVIVTESVIGEGTEKDPARCIYQYWDLKGNLLAKKDTLNDLEKKLVAVGTTTNEKVVNIPLEKGKLQL